MGKSISLRVLSSIFIVNAAGFTLKYLDLDTYVIFIGFRFHLSFVLPFIILFQLDKPGIYKTHFIKPCYKGKFLPALWAIVPFLIILLVLLLSDNINIADPKYFYELGLSSIFDYPVYLLWNFPQFIILFLFLSVVTSSIKKKVLPVAFLVILLFAFEFIPDDFHKIDYLIYLELFITAVSAGIFIQFFHNVYWFAVLFFTIFWVNLLAFGSQSSMMVNILFAAQYSAWEGFFISDVSVHQYLLPAQLLILVLIMLPSVYLRRKEKDVSSR